MKVKIGNSRKSNINNSFSGSLAKNKPGNGYKLCKCGGKRILYNTQKIKAWKDVSECKNTDDAERKELLEKVSLSQ